MAKLYILGLIYRWTTSAQCSKRLLNRNDIRRQLRNDALQDTTINIRRIGRRLNRVVRNNIPATQIVSTIPNFYVCIEMTYTL